MTRSPDRPNVGTKHEEEPCNSDMTPGVEPGWTQGEPLDIGRIPMKLECLYRYALDMAYCAPTGNDETLRTFKLRVHNTLLTMTTATRETREMRTDQLHPDTQWKHFWKNLHTIWVSEEIASVWNIVVHDIVPTIVRLVESDRLGHCGRRDTLVHRLME